MFEAQVVPFNDTPFTRYLFNTQKYLIEYPTQNLMRFWWGNSDSESDRFISITGQLLNQEFTSIPWATFGGVEYSDQLKTEDFDEFINHVIRYGDDNGIKSLSITMPPDIYEAGSESIKNILLKHDFDAIQADLNQHIEITADNYQDRVAYNELKKLRKCKREGFHFQQLDVSELDKAYDLIKDNRIRKGFPVSMTFEALKKMFEKLPEVYQLFGVKDDHKLVAVAVSIRIDKYHLYNFYHGDHAEYRVFSPVVMLLEGIYAYCRQRDIKILDLGISSEQGQLNEGLFRFKKNCGASSSDKNIFYRSLV